MTLTNPKDQSLKKVTDCFRTVLCFTNHPSAIANSSMCDLRSARARDMLKAVLPQCYFWNGPSRVQISACAVTRRIHSSRQNWENRANQPSHSHAFTIAGNIGGVLNWQFSENLPNLIPRQYFWPLRNSARTLQSIEVHICRGKGQGKDREIHC